MATSRDLSDVEMEDSSNTSVDDEDSVFQDIDNDSIFALIDTPLTPASSKSDYYLINPTSMTVRDAYIATQFLLFQLQQWGEILTHNNVIYENIPIKRPGTAEVIEAAVEFTHDIALYHSNKYPGQDRFAVVGRTLVGWGGDCNVWKVKGKLKPSLTGTLFYQSDKYKSDDQKWVARYETHSAHLSADQAVAVYELAKGNKNLGMKHPMWTGSVSKKGCGMSVSIMRRLKDYNLEDVLHINQSHHGYLDGVLKKSERWDLCELFKLMELDLLQLSDLDILRYSHATAVAYKEQVQKLGLMHRDIKAENILIDLTKGPVPAAITIVDYTYARRIGTTDSTSICGTPGYIAPEILEGENPTSNEADIYSLACTLAQWFKDDSAYDELPEDDPRGYQQSINRQFTQLAASTPDEIKSLLNRMVARDPDERPTIDQVINEHEDVIEMKEFDLRLSAASSPSAKK